MAHERCFTDDHCPKNTYCYNITNVCISYADCSVWYRTEAEKPARNISECGPCMSGYFSAILTSGQEKDSCNKKNPEGLVLWTNEVIIVIVIMVFFSILLTCYTIYTRLYKKYLQTNTNAEDKYPNVTTASAPPTQDRLIGIDKEEYSAMQNNNGNIAKDIEKYQTARAFNPPSWINNANYGTNRIDFDDTDDISVPDIENVNLPLCRNENDNLDNNNDNNNQLRLAYPMIDISVNADRQDNTTNPAVSQFCPHASDSNVDSTPGPNENGHSKKKPPTNVIINQLLHHNITMNVNVFNGEEC